MLMTLASALLVLAAQDAPVATSPTAPRTEVVAPPAQPVEAPLPQGAPSDDYGLVAWCHGALRGHLELAEAIQDTLPVDAEQQTLGRQYLKTYEDALAAAAQAKTSEGLIRANQARDSGYQRWNAARASTSRQTQTFSYLGWQLPGRCDQAAKRLTTGGDLLGAALRGSGTPAPATTTPAPAATPAPAPAETPAAPATPQ
jgi:hypothetical protein